MPVNRGYKIFDFGRSKQNTGSFDFKKNWGFEPQPLYYEYQLHRARRCLIIILSIPSISFH